MKDSRLSSCLMAWLFSVLLAGSMVREGEAADWPTYRGDAERTGYTAEAIPNQMRLRWRFHPGLAPKPAWASSERIEFDQAYQPVLAGGLLLLWVAYNMYRELRPIAPVIADDPDTPAIEGPPASKTFFQAALQITLADLSMSLDNVLAVAAVARQHPTVLFFGLALSVTLMGLAANLVAKLVQRYHWIAWIGLIVILYVALNMIWEGWFQIAPLIGR